MRCRGKLLKDDVIRSATKYVLIPRRLWSICSLYAWHLMQQRLSGNVSKSWLWCQLNWIWFYKSIQTCFWRAWWLPIFMTPHQLILMDKINLSAIIIFYFEKVLVVIHCSMLGISVSFKFQCHCGLTIRRSFYFSLLSFQWSNYLSYRHVLAWALCFYGSLPMYMIAVYMNVVHYLVNK